MKRSKSGFSLIELMISMGILTVILTVLAFISSSTLKTWRASTDEQLKFRNAKNAYDAVFTRLSTAELNPYWGYEFGQGANQSPTAYKKLSDLHFVCGSANGDSGPALIPNDNRLGHAVFFHGAYGVTDIEGAEQLGLLLNSWGFYLEFGPEKKLANFLETEGGIEPRYRFRLMELQVKSEDVTTYSNENVNDEMDLNEASDSADLFKWFRNAVDNGQAHQLAENIIALVIAPIPPNKDDETFDETTLAPNYYYDTRAFQNSENNLTPKLLSQSEHQLPPVVRVTMVAITEGSAIALENQFGTTQPDLGLSGLFTDLGKYDEDIETLREELISRRINFQIFTDTVKLRNSKWSDQETIFQ